MCMPSNCTSSIAKCTNVLQPVRRCRQGVARIFATTPLLLGTQTDCPLLNEQSAGVAAGTNQTIVVLRPIYTTHSRTRPRAAHFLDCHSPCALCNKGFLEKHIRIEIEYQVWNTEMGRVKAERGNGSASVPHARAECTTGTANQTPNSRKS